MIPMDIAQNIAILLLLFALGVHMFYEKKEKKEFIDDYKRWAEKKVNDMFADCRGSVTIIKGKAFDDNESVESIHMMNGRPFGHTNTGYDMQTPFITAEELRED